MTDETKLYQINMIDDTMVFKVRKKLTAISDEIAECQMMLGAFQDEIRDTRLFTCRERESKQDQYPLNIENRAHLMTHLLDIKNWPPAIQEFGHFLDKLNAIIQWNGSMSTVDACMEMMWELQKSESEVDWALAKSQANRKSSVELVGIIKEMHTAIKVAYPSVNEITIQLRQEINSENRKRTERIIKKLNEMGLYRYVGLMTVIKTYCRTIRSASITQEG